MEAKVHGRVQMVMFRDFVCRKSRALGLVGTVRNLPDGTVAVVAEGSRKKLERLEILLRGGSLLSSVQEVQTSFGKAERKFVDFSIAYD